MKVFLYILIITLSASNGFSLAHTKRHCSTRDREYARSFDNYYDPEEAYRFGQRIIKLVRDEDLRGLFALVDGELRTGPRKSMIRGHNFRDIFSKSWKIKLIKSIPPCAPVGGRGFMLDDGEIWFDKKQNKWHIFSINGARPRADKIVESLEQEEQRLHRLGKTYATHSISMEKKQSLARPKNYWYKRKN